MLIRFTVDPDIFSGSATNLDIKKKHANLLKLWRTLGLLVIPGDKQLDSKLYEAICKAPQAIQTMWKEGLKHNRKTSCSSNFASALAQDTPFLKEGEVMGIRLACLDRDRAELWGLGPDEYSKVIAKSMEICRFGDEDQASIVRSALDFANRPINSEETPEAIWRTKISDLSTNSRFITIVDRYALRNFIENKCPGHLDGLQFLISKIAMANTPDRKIINIFSSYSVAWNLFDPSASFEDGMESLSFELKNRLHRFVGESISEIALHITRDSVFGSIVHYRYILFDQRNLLQLDTGLEPLSDFPGYVRRTCPCHHYEWQSELADAFRNDEKKLRSKIDYTSKFSL